MKKLSLNVIGLWVNLSRAYEIALLGKHSIDVFHSEDYLTASEDFEVIKDFYKMVTFEAGGGIQQEITPPNFNHFLNARHTESLEDIHKRVTKAMKNETPQLVKNDGIDSLLRAAMQRLGVSVKGVHLIHNMAVTIAQLDNSKVVRIEHIAEAVQYRSHEKDETIRASDNTKLFANGSVSVYRGLHDKEEINKVIAYLKKQII